MVGSAPTCKGTRTDGKPCRATPTHESGLCFWHDPALAEEAAEARRHGGIRRRREKTLAAAYDLDGFETVPQIGRLIEIVIMDGLALENTVDRGRLLLAAAQAEIKLLQVGEFGDLLRQIAAALEPRLEKHLR